MTAPDFTLFDVLAWARTKPADEAYDFVHAETCALGQFAREKLGISEADAKCGLYEIRCPKALIEAANGFHGSIGWTFGALVTRLEALCPRSEWVRVEAYGRCPAGRSAALRAEPVPVSGLRPAAAIARGAL